MKGWTPIIIIVLVLLSNVILMRDLARQRQEIASLTVAIRDSQSPSQTVDRERRELRDSLERGLSNQAAILSRITGKAISTTLPAQTSADLASLETIVLDPTKWPTSEASALTIRQRLADITRSIPAWAEEDFLPRLNRVRWGVGVITNILNADRLQGLKRSQASVDETNKMLEELKSLQDIMPEDVPSSINGRLSSYIHELEIKYSAIRRAQAIDDAKSAIAARSIDNLPTTLTALETLSQDDQVLALKNDAKKTLVERQAELQFGEFQKQFNEATAFTDEQLRQTAISRIYESAMSQKIMLRFNGSIVPSIDKSLSELIKACEENLKMIAMNRQAAQLADQAEKLRRYQKWALQQVQNFKAEYAAIEKTVSEEDSKHFVGAKPGWQEKHFLAVATAMEKHLLPVNSSLLEQAVSTFYSQAYDLGWNKLRDGEDKLYIAKQAAIVVKQSPDLIANK